MDISKAVTSILFFYQDCLIKKGMVKTMKIAVTGASGFIGTEILEELQKREDVEVTALTRSREHSRKNSVRCIWKQTDFSVESLKTLFQGVDVVIHLAAVRGTAGCISDYHANETITENILIAMGEEKVKRIVFASSIAVYSDTETIPWREDSLVEPKTLYGITKASCEYLCRYYAKKYGFAYSIARVAQVAGLGEKRKGMMNVFIDTARQHGRIRVMGKSTAKRQYVYVKDLAVAMAAMAEAEGQESGIVNVGMKQAYTNLEIAQAVNQVFENEMPVDYDSSTAETIESSQMDVTCLEKEYGLILADMEQTFRNIRKELEDMP